MNNQCLDVGRKTVASEIRDEFDRVSKSLMDLSAEYHEKLYKIAMAEEATKACSAVLPPLSPMPIYF